MPGSQSVHTRLAAPSVYRPTGQFWQSLALPAIPLAAVVPAEQGVQSNTDVPAPDATYRPGPQSVQLVDPAVEYLPTAQSMKPEGFNTYLPGGASTHADKATPCPAATDFPIGQG